MGASCLKSTGALGGEVRETLQVDQVISRAICMEKTRDELTWLSMQELLLAKVDYFAQTLEKHLEF